MVKKVAKNGDGCRDCGEFGDGHDNRVALGEPLGRAVVAHLQHLDLVLCANASGKFYFRATECGERLLIATTKQWRGISGSFGPVKAVFIGG
ncbi:MAG: hypothetical protein ABI583_10575 [Betaproteobacteria bacterium]